MQRTPHRCPFCATYPLFIHRGLWWPYYLCQHCGRAAEGGDEPALRAAEQAGRVPPHLMDAPQTHRLRQPGQLR